MATDAYHEANALFVDGEYEAAVQAYGRALEADPNNAVYFAKRAAAQMRLGNHIDAVADMSKSLKISPDLKGYLLKGEALFCAEEYDTAALAFRKALELAPESIVARRWIRKCEAEISGAVVVVAPATAPLAVAASSTPPVAVHAPVAPLPTPAAPLPATTDPSRVRHEYYQTLTHVVVSILIRGASEEAVSVEYERAALSVCVKLAGMGSEYQLHLSLFAQVETSECSHTVTPAKIEVKLKKAVAAKWDSLEGTGEGGIPAYQQQAAQPGPSMAMDDTPSRPAYPTSRPKKTDWDKVEHEVKREEEETKLEGDEALQKLFRDIYARSDEDTRRAMNKSFQTSGGTVLSTNWAEVGTKDYEKERTAPAGQEWKKWG